MDTAKSARVVVTPIHFSFLYPASRKVGVISRSKEPAVLYSIFLVFLSRYVLLRDGFSFSFDISIEHPTMCSLVFVPVPYTGPIKEIPAS